MGLEGELDRLDQPGLRSPTQVNRAILPNQASQPTKGVMRIRYTWKKSARPESPRWAAAQEQPRSPGTPGEPAAVGWCSRSSLGPPRRTPPHG
eukprot:5286115-Pyramimonas_sp.AAC.2